MGTIIGDLNIQSKSIFQNASTRLPICICVDASYSMRFDRRMEQVNEGIRSFIKEINEDVYAVDSVELCIVSFGESVKVERNFKSNEVNSPSRGETNANEFKDIVANGRTPLGHAVQTAVDLITGYTEYYKRRGIIPYKPWLILISDGAATDSTQEAARRVLNMQRDGELKVLCIGIGDEANDLAQFKLDGEVIQLKDFGLSDFFSWLSKSMSKQSKRQPEADFEIPGQDDLRKLRR